MQWPELHGRAQMKIFDTANAVSLWISECLLTWREMDANVPETKLRKKSMDKNIVALGRAKTDPDPRIVEELERFLKLAKAGRIKTLVMSAEVPDPDNWEKDEIRSRWFEVHQPNTAHMVNLLGVAQNLANAVGMNLWNMGYAPTDEDLAREDEEDGPDDG